MIRYVNVFMIVVFLLSVAVQYNDPDGLLWMAVYGLAAGLSAAYFFGRLRWSWAAVLAAFAAVWSVALYPRFAGRVTPGELLGAFSMKSAAIEYAREAGGLLIVVVWMVVLAFNVKSSTRVDDIDGIE